MKRCVVNVATGHYVKGQERLGRSLGEIPFVMFKDAPPRRSPAHSDVPYAFKAHALDAATRLEFSTLLWADASILPIRPLGPLFDRIERDGYWISRNGWTNAEWTADTAYADLDISREENAKVPHVVATAFGLSLLHPTGEAIFNEYLRLAKTRAFCGPWWNSNSPAYGKHAGAQPCGGPEVHGHRHDQTALSVIAWNLNLELSNPPEIFAYRGGETEETILVADGSY